eukprot:2461001-Pyramimonas_sp.AAC.1
MPRLATPRSQSHSAHQCGCAFSGPRSEQRCPRVLQLGSQEDAQTRRTPRYPSPARGTRDLRGEAQIVQHAASPLPQRTA